MACNAQMNKPRYKAKQSKAKRSEATTEHAIQESSWDGWIPAGTSCGRNGCMASTYAPAGTQPAVEGMLQSTLPALRDWFTARESSLNQMKNAARSPIHEDIASPPRGSCKSHTRLIHDPSLHLADCQAGCHSRLHGSRCSTSAPPFQMQCTQPQKPACHVLVGVFEEWTRTHRDRRHHCWRRRAG
jgi:hypothetical protein